MATGSARTTATRRPEGAVGERRPGGRRQGGGGGQGGVLALRHPVDERADGHTDGEHHEPPSAPMAGAGLRRSRRGAATRRVCADGAPRRGMIPSTASTSRPRHTSGTDSAPAAWESNWNSVKISVVKVWNRRISNTPYSEITVRTTRTHPAEHGRADEGKRDPQERPRRADAEAVGGVLHGRVGPAQRSSDGQVDQRIGAERHDQGGAEEPVDGGVDRVPRVPHHEVGDGHGQHEQHGPQPAVPGAAVRSVHHAVATPMTAARTHHQDRDRHRVLQAGPATAAGTGRGGSRPSPRRGRRGRAARAGAGGPGR